jgi:CHAD domain-containing protein
MLALISKRVDQLLDALPGVRDGRSDSVHDARVASRRLRELLPFVGDDERAASAHNVAEEAGCQLGRVRDLEVMTQVLTKIEAHVPATALAVASIRRDIFGRLRKERRALIKALEALEVGRLVAFHSGPSNGRHSRWAMLLNVEPSWTQMLRDRIESRAHAMSAAVDHAAGVYFPNRLHKVRIAVKKLRYIVEVAHDVDAWNPPHLLNDLKQVQSVLGDLHDAHVLLKEIRARVPNDMPAAESGALASVLESDIARLHASYLEKRDRLRVIATVCERFAVFAAHRRLAVKVSRATAAASVLSLMAVPGTVRLLHRRVS